MSHAAGSYLEQELVRRHDARRAAGLAHDFEEADALIAPFVLAVARLAAQRDARRQNCGAELEDEQVSARLMFEAGNE